LSSFKMRWLSAARALGAVRAPTFARAASSLPIRSAPFRVTLDTNPDVRPGVRALAEGASAPSL